MRGEPKLSGIAAQLFLAVRIFWPYGVSIDPIGYDAGKKIKGIKRNALVDTEGHLLSLEVIPAHIQDRDCAAGLIERALRKYPRLKKIFADGGYAGPKLASALCRVADRAGNRQTHRQGRGLQSLASPLGNRAHILLATPQSPFDGPLRSPCHDRHRFCKALDDSCHAEAADAGDPLIYRANFRFRLLRGQPVPIP